MLFAAPKIPRVASARVERALIDLDRALGTSKLIVDENARRVYAEDDSQSEACMPDVVVVAESREDVAAVMRIAEEHEVPVTPRAGGSGRTGGAVPVAGGIVLATHKMAKVVDVDRENLIAVVQPGVVLGAFHSLVENEGMFYAPDPNSADMCMIGGNVAENAGGPRAFKYGSTRDHVLGLEAVFMGGRTMRVGKRVVKGVTGYDVTALLVGSEGTLGVFTEITLRLLPRPPEVATLLALYTDVAAAGASVSRLIAAGLVPRCIEMMDAATLGAVRAAGNAIDERAGAMLLIEVDGQDAESQLERLGNALGDAAGTIDLVVAQDSAQRARLWAARKSLSYATRKMATHKIAEDVVVPRSRIAALLEATARIGEREKVRNLTYGHAGDGNLHVNFLWDTPDEEPRVARAVESLMKTTVELGGTLSGEHGVGLAKAPYLHFEQSEDLIALQKDVKRVFDPKGLLNPGKIFPVSHAGC
ncbi:MAG TPA: FAD-linked oxidase C-terminal domain-containing protein [Polyangiaceae bacterium]